MTAQWYAMHGKPRKGDLLLEQLQARKIEIYHPRIEVQTVNPRARQVKPYFPSYVLMRVDLDRVYWSSLHWIPEAIGLIAFGGKPATAPDSLIRIVRHSVDRVNADGGEQVAGLQRGDRVGYPGWRIR